MVTTLTHQQMPTHYNESIAQLRKILCTDEENMSATLLSQDKCSGWCVCSLVVVFNTAVNQADWSY